MKKILIVSPYFAPEQSVASIRFTKIAKYLQEMGYDVTVLCTQMFIRWIEDKTLEDDFYQIKKVVRIRYPEFLYYKVIGYWGSEGKQVYKKEKNVNSEASMINALIGSLAMVYGHFCNILLGRRFIKHVKNQKQKYDVVITTYNPIAGHILGNYMKKKNLCTTWIEDFRDPLGILHDKSWATTLLHWHGVQLMRNSDYITTVSKGAAKSLIKEARTFGVDIKHKLRIITNGFDNADREALREYVSEKDKLFFTYCGTIYVVDGQIKNDISPLFEALSNLIEKKEIDKDFIEVRYAGKYSDLFMEFAQEYGMSELVHLEGVIGRDESLKLQKESDIIIVPVWNNKGDTGILSGKFFETLLVQRNVLCIVTGNQPGSELSSIVEDLGCGFSYEEINGDKSDMESLEEWILTKYNEKRQHNVLKYCGNNREQKYSHESLAKNFEKLF